MGRLTISSGRREVTASLPGIHHVTAITGDVQKCVDFYVSTLGLRFVKKSINQDVPDTYHIYFGDYLGSPATAMTFFGWPEWPARRTGSGQVTTVSFAVPHGSLNYWDDRLRKLGVDHHRTVHFATESIVLHDPDGIELELAAKAARPLGAVARLAGRHGPRDPRLPLRDDDGRGGFRERRAADADDGIPAGVEGGEPHAVPDGRGRPARHPRRRRIARGAGGGGVDRHGAPRRVADGGRLDPGGMARGAGRGRAQRDAGHRPLVLQVDLLPRAGRSALRDRHGRPGFHGRRDARKPRHVAEPAAVVPGAARPPRRDVDADRRADHGDDRRRPLR